MTVIDVSAAAVGGDDEAVDYSLLVAARWGASWRPESARTPYTSVAERVAASPDRLAGVAGVDPTRHGTPVTELREAVGEHGFVAAHLTPHAFGIPPDDRQWYPAYTVCAELGIPVQIELGIRPSPGPRLRSVGQPIALDEVAADFPELTLVAIGAWPWVNEAISVAYKHANVFLTVGPDDPGMADPSLRRFADSWGAGKVMFASAGGDPRPALDRVHNLDLRAASLQSCLGEVAKAVFGITNVAEP